MKWKDAFADAMKELEAIRSQLGRLDDPTVGLTALHGELTQSRLKILEVVQGGVTGLREENREVRRRQDRMISDLNETRGELRQLLDLVDALGPLVRPAETGGEPGDSRLTDAGTAPAVPGAQTDDSAATTTVQPPTSTNTATESQGGTVENSEREPEHKQDQDLELKRAIEAAYQGTAVPAAEPAAPASQAPAVKHDPLVAHGVLLLKAAGVASADLTAHRDTWEWLSALAVNHSHFRTPPSVDDIKDGRIQTVLSGRSLIALLIELWNTRSSAPPFQSDWALATTAYHRIAAKLAGVHGQGDTIHIILDDGLPPGTDD
ncbi:hypothetical protein [Streptomyces sp. AM 2-1-1]|uniref:hypothetical protein n=1 Tax=Streptomyces sp. AM 2-1-1 TaxID=3028709 RepID=UPI0023B9385C|nr:hypothetical protein [Streptomyces sp. AM 2-1-1]WEH43996.1 hypothetical protein PZB77_31015 [Streptomyces sp. AM 2-1-1]